MTEITTGIRSLLQRPSVYHWLQVVMGGERSRRVFVEKYVRARDGDRILDIGCGPADILAFLPKVSYVGYDPNPRYIERASATHGAGGRFHVGTYGETEIAAHPPFDIAIVSAVLHHLDDLEARHLFNLLKRSLKPGGRVVTLDNVYIDNQNPVARLLISWDRGRNVRTAEGYKALALSSFANVDGDVRHIQFPPYTHWIMECR
jgi:SAM-dependent methyltransferase